MPTISSIHIYPVKSLGGIDLPEAELLERGLKYDREWMVVDQNGHFITQREIPEMALIQTAITDSALLLSQKDNGELNVPLRINESAPQMEVRVWRDDCLATDEGDEAADFLSDALGRRVRLVRMQKSFKRQVDQNYARSQDDIVGFADGFPVLVISLKSLEELNRKLEYPILMNRFRPNLTIAGTSPFAEDQWSTMGTDNIQLAICKPCARCPITTIDQETAQMSKEPLRTLSFFRKQNGKVMFGQNAVVVKTGRVKVGDVLQVSTSN